MNLAKISFKVKITKFGQNTVMDSLFGGNIVFLSTVQV